MPESKETKKPKFLGIEIAPDLTKTNFFFLYFNTLIVGAVMSVPAIIQPAFLSDIIKIDQAFTGSINGLLQNMSQIATLAFVAAIGVLSDKVGRKILAFLGFIVMSLFYYLMSASNEIASLLSISSELASPICALLSFMPGKAAEFNEFSPGLLITYLTRFIIGVGLVLAYPQFITMVADYTYEKDRGKGMAMNGVMMGISALFVFAVFAPIQKKVGIINLMYIVAVFSLLGAVCTWRYLKDRMPAAKEKKPGFFEIIPEVRKSLPLKASYLCTMVTRPDIVVLATLLVTWGVKYGQEIQMASKDATMKAALPMMVMGVISLLLFPVCGILIDKWGRVQTIILTLFSAGLGMILLAVSPNPFGGLVYLAVIFTSFGMAGTIAGANTLAADVSPKAMIGSILGGLNTMQPIGVLFFLGTGGYLFDVLGPGWAFGVKGAASFILGIWMFLARNSIMQEAREASAIEKITFTMEWDDEAKQMLEKVPGAFRPMAAAGTEEYARTHNHRRVTAQVMNDYRKELGM